VRKALEPNAATTHFALVAMPPEAGSDVTIVLGRDIVDARHDPRRGSSFRPRW